MLKRSFLYLFCLLAISGMAQSRKRTFRQSELGFFGGGSYYLGDLNQRTHFLASHWAGGLFYRYSTNYRYSFRFGFNYGDISGNDAVSDNADQKERNLSFKSQLYELNATAEFNFVEYRIGHDKHNFTLFIFAGLSTFYFNPKSSLGGDDESLRDHHTEGKSYPKVQISTPFGVGLKWNMGEHCGMGIEWGPRHTWTDYLDDVSGTYPAGVGGDGKGFTDRTVNGSAVAGGMRGNPSTKDWYFYYGVTLNIKLPGRKSCYGKGIKIRSAN